MPYRTKLPILSPTPFYYIFNTMAHPSVYADSGREFENRLLNDFCILYIKLTYTTVHHPQANGSVETFYATLMEMISANVASEQEGNNLNMCVNLKF